MKLLVAFFALTCIIGVYSDEINNYPIKPPKQLIHECAEEFKIDDAMLDEIKTKKNFSKNRDTQCFAGCLVENSGIMTPEKKMSKAFEDTHAGTACKDWNGNDDCEISANVMNCLFQKDFISLDED